MEAIIYFILMGVSGSGKSTLAELIASAFNLPLFEGDDYHPEANIQKMASGVPLEDVDRKAWLENLVHAVHSSGQSSGIIACSALTSFVQSVLDRSLPTPPIYILVEIAEDIARDRITRREDHFMPAGLLKSQFAALSPPTSAHRVSNNGDLTHTYTCVAEIIEACLDPS